jgi:hypothetical protein
MKATVDFGLAASQNVVIPNFKFIRSTYIMFAKFVEPHSVEPSSQETVEELKNNLTIAHNLFLDGSISSDHDFKKDFNEDIGYFIQESIDSGKSLTKTLILDAIMEDWFNTQSVPFMYLGQLPEDGHSIVEDFKNFSCKLAQEMDLQDCFRISPTDTPKLWNTFFNNSNELAMRNGARACPLIKDGNGYKFIHDDLSAYFRASGVFQDFLNDNFTV